MGQINNFTLRFASDSLEEDYYRHYEKELARQAPLSFLFGFIMFSSFAAYATFSFNSTTQFITLYNVSVVVLAAIISVVYFTRKIPYNIHAFIVLIISSLYLFSIVYGATIVTQFNSRLYISIVILILFWTLLLIGIDFLRGLIYALLCFIIMVALLIFVSSYPNSFRFTGILVMFNATMMVLFMAYWFEKQRRNNYLQFKEIVETKNQAEVFYKSLLSSEQRFEILVKELPLLIISMDNSGNILFCNKKFEELTGYSFSEVNRETKVVYSLFSISEDTNLSDLFRNNANRYDQFEMNLTNKDGESITVNWSQISRDSMLARDRIWAVGVDFTEQRKYLNQLKTSQQRLQLSQQVARIGSWEWNLLDNSYFWSPELYQMFGLADKQGQNPRKLFPEIIHPDDVAFFKENLRQCIRDKVRPNFEFRIYHPEKKLRIIALTGDFVYDHHDNIKKLYGINQDISDQKFAKINLIRNQKSLKQAQRIARLGSWERDFVKKTAYWSKQMYDIHNIDPAIPADEAENVFFNKLDKNVRQRIRSSIKDAIRQRSSFSVEFAYLENSGDPHYYLLEGIVESDRNQKPVRLYGINQDITERKKAEQVILQSEERYRLLVDKIQDAMFIIQHEKFVFVNNAFSTITGYSVSEILQQHFTDFIAPEYLERVISYNNSKMTNNSDNETIEMELIVKNNKRLIVVVNVGNIVINGINSTIGTFKDVTTERNVIKAIKRNEKLIENLLSATPSAILELSLDGKIVRMNPAARNLFRIMGDENSEGQDFHNFFDSKQLHHYDEILRNTQSAGKHRLPEADLVRANKQQFLAQLDSNILVDNNNEAYGMVLIVRDITQQRRYVDILKQQKQKAEEADKLKTAFLANMSHEIRTPMNAIIGFSNILSTMELAKQERNEYIGYITSSGKTLLKLIDDIIDISKLDAGQLEIVPTKFILAYQYKNIQASILEHIRRLKKQHLKLICDTMDMADIELNTDPIRLEQVLVNLLTNAVKFTDEGSIRFGHYRSDNDMVVFYVEDSGIGMNQEETATIFERFRKIDSDQNRLYRGAGLGLSITKNLVQHLGGKIYVKSTEGKGSRFEFNIKRDLESKNIVQ